MARTASNKSTSSKKATGKSKAASPAQKRAAKQAAPAPAKPQIFDERTKRDITGVAVTLLGIVLFVAAVVPTDALITSFVSQLLHLCLGIGAYLLPFFLVAIGASCLVRIDKEGIPLRASVGLAMLFVAVLSLLALFTPETTPDATDNLFLADQLSARGGYIGAGIAWCGLTLFGKVISAIVLFGLAIAGLIVIGFSVSSIVDKLRALAAAREEAEEREHGVVPAPAFARVSRPKAKAVDEPELAELETAKTQMLKQPAASNRRHGSAVASSDDGASREDASKAPETITRKLGRRKPIERAAAAPAMPKKPSKAATPVATPRPEQGFELPPFDLLATSTDPEKDLATDSELQETGACLQETLEDFNIMAKVVGWVAGPTVTLFKVDLPAGVRVSRVTALEDDIALALAAPGVRIFAPIPGTNYVGIEVPNRTRQTVLLGDVIKDAAPGPLQIAIGKDVEGHCIVSDLAKMPHLLIGGTTGSGKSVSINAMIMSILMRATPSEVRFIMIDPKRVEFTPYNGIPHLYVPVVTEPKEAASALSWGVAEMERRLKVFSKVGARNIGQYNAKVQSAQAEAKAAQEAGEDLPENELGDELPYIVIIIDELADLMMNVGKEVEFSISRIAQLARAAGIHLIVATQRPSTNVVTGLIKANITNRIAFNVASGIDSRVILDTPGAENLIGLGDLLLSKPEYAKPMRIQGCYVSEDEINAVVEKLRSQGEPEYHSEILSTNLITLGSCPSDASGGTCADDDPLIWEAAELVVSSGLGSTSNIQRRLKVGYSRAGRIMDMLEDKGVVGPPNGSKPREVLVDAMELETLKAFEQHDGDNQ
ncbi:FtsK/SpoIIIE family DNA translocase [Senegalimassilia anaerobia]|uniref:FtsK/SpoIIIE family DNA translocase n=2 Tax=Senegalimassilia anaerobia TaxID=1473216 RepID=UPI00026D2E2F|nr:DNA translocase FtsK [Senegalimassilia anaerobia]